jgi:hypothetical protein
MAAPWLCAVTRMENGTVTSKKNWGEWGARHRGRARYWDTGEEAAIARDVQPQLEHSDRHCQLKVVRRIPM